MKKSVLTCQACISIMISAQDPDLKFKHITTRDGQSQNMVSCIFQDSRGFMWFGTQDGLGKYDGYSDQEIKDMIGIISDSADNVYNLLDNLLNWSRVKGPHFS